MTSPFPTPPLPSTTLALRTKQDWPAFAFLKQRQVASAAPGRDLQAADLVNLLADFIVMNGLPLHTVDKDGTRTFVNKLLQLEGEEKKAKRER